MPCSKLEVSTAQHGRLSGAGYLHQSLRQGADGEQEVGFASDPSPAVEGDAAAGDETMDMRMMGQRLPPGVQDGDEADCGAEAFGGEGHERLGRRAHQETVDRLLVRESDL